MPIEQFKNPADVLARAHWNETPLFVSEDERYSLYPWLPEAAEFREHRGERVLEIGCGTGCDLLQFAKHGAKAYGIDITEEHLCLAKQRVGKMAKVIYGDARSIPYPDEAFDYVYSHGVIHHSDKPKQIASEILRVLKPAGRFNIHVYALLSYATLYGVKHFGYFTWKARHIENSEAPVFVELYTARKLRSLFPGVKIGVSKHHLPEWPSLAKYLGWYLVAGGRKAPKH